MKERRHFSRSLITRMVAVLALCGALGSAACSDEFSPTEPISISAAHVGTHTTRTTKTTTTERIKATATKGPSGNLALGTGQLTARVRTVRALIGNSGGSLNSTNTAGDASHTLSVPPGAVRVPTLFVMELADDGTIAVDLSATEVESGNQVTQFEKDLTLSLSYAEADVAEPNALYLVYVVDGEIVEVISSSVDPRRKVVIGDIRHFSRYAVAWE